MLFKILIHSETKLVTLTESFTELICSIINSGTLTQINVFCCLLKLLK